MDNSETWTITMVCWSECDPYVDTFSVGFPLDVELTDRVSISKPSPILPIFLSEYWLWSQTKLIPKFKSYDYYTDSWRSSQNCPLWNTVLNNQIIQMNDTFFQNGQGFEKWIMNLLDWLAHNNHCRVQYQIKPLRHIVSKYTKTLSWRTKFVI